jgi:peptide-methionine (S)-S-oxide reductase
MPRLPLIARSVVAVLVMLAFCFAPAAFAQDAKTEIATIGSGCFWCTESDFDKVPGVVATTSGYMGGDTANATYEKVSRGWTGHYEVVQVTYDPAKVSYQALLDHYWRTTDVVDGGGQFCDRGSQYKPVIFTHTEEQARLAAAGKAALTAAKRFDRPIAVEIIAAKPFTAAEDYHQDFYKKNPGHYQRYRVGCGRDARIKALWGGEAGH